MPAQDGQMLDAGEAAFLQQAHRNNWQKYAASLRPEGAAGWDLCILTASDERQAAMYRQQLAWRRESGLLPARTEFVVLPDPAGRQAGSGGATLFALAAAEELRQAKAGSIPPCPPGRPPASEPGRVLIIHSGGDSRRLPHCSATGKLFARIPRTLPDRRWSTVFDEFLITLSGLAGEGLPPGVLVASGDVLLVFDHLQLSFLRGGIIGVTAAAPARMGEHHGAYVSGDGGHRVRAYLHKPSEQELADWGAIGPDGLVQIDTGLLWFDAATAAKLVRLAQRLVPTAPQASAVGQDGAAAPTLNLYGDLLLPTAQSTTLDSFLAQDSDGPATPALQAARRTIWEHLRTIPLSVEHLQPAVFVHLGTSREYWQMTAGDRALAQLCGWSGIEPGAPAPINAWLAPASATSAAAPSVEQRAALVSDSCLEGPLSWQGAALVAGVQTAQPLALGADMVVHQLPLVGGGYVTRAFGLHDDPKQLWDSPGATVFNRPWAEWLAGTGISPEALWDDVPASRRTLWTARLYPLSQEREESLALTLLLGAAENAAVAAHAAHAPCVGTEDGWRARWAAAPRLSLGESLLRADGERILADIVVVEDQVATRAFCAAVESEQPAQTAAQVLGNSRSALARRAGPVAARFASGGPLLCLRGYKALGEATGDNAWEDRALATLAQMIEQATPRQAGSKAPHGRLAVDVPGAGSGGRTAGSTVRALASARIDFGGGWSDTPPHSIERGGTVLNAALTLRGAYPISAEAECLAEPRLILESRDIDTATEVGCLAELLTYTNPADPFALHKAALVLRGLAGAEHIWTGPARGTVDLNRPIGDVMRALGGGLRLTTQTGIPRGSGLGTSSIMAGAVLACLGALLEGASDGPPSAEAHSPSISEVRLFDEVLCLEQMLTTGGGWQDQVGGLTGGIKLVTTGPGLPQQIRITPTRLSPEAETGLAARLLLVYTGQQRLAKNLLRAVMGRWMARDPEMVWLLHQIGQLAQAMRYALEAGDLSCCGALLSEHWALNKRMDPGCTNPFIDELFTVMTPYIAGAKLPGAGGGGFVMAIARDAGAVDELAKMLVSRYPGTPVRVWPCAVPREGLQIQWGIPTFGDPA
jgi:fucokinase